MEKFSEACVIASTHTIVLVQNALEANYLPRRNPFVIYFLFAATLVLMSNEFALLYVNSAADQCIRNAITFMTYSAETDPQASRLLYILSTFRDVIITQRDHRARQQHSANQLPPFNMKANINPYGMRPSQSPMQIDDQDGKSFNLPSVADATSGNYGPRASINSIRSNSNSGPSSLGGIHLLSSAYSQTPTTFPSMLHNTTRPLEPSLTSPAPPNPLSPYPSGMQTPTLGSLERQLSFSNIFDLSHLTTDGVSVSGDSNGPDEHIDFDALWAWGNNTSAVGSPKLGQTSGLLLPSGTQASTR
jgi:hypothetical protein